jgi:hypothetical protein
MSFASESPEDRLCAKEAKTQVAICNIIQELMFITHFAKEAKTQVKLAKY